MPNNNVILKGHLGATPKLIEKDNKLFVAFSMATQDGYYNDSNEWVAYPSVWHQILAFNDTAIVKAQELSKGQKVEVTGSLSYRDFDAQLENKQLIKKKEATIIARSIKPLTASPTTPTEPK